MITTQNLNEHEELQEPGNNKLMGAFEAHIEMKLKEKDLEISKLRLLVYEAMEEIAQLKTLYKLADKS